MATWNSAYELNPQNFKNPGEGAFHFRDLKVAVRERNETEHFWGEDENTEKGWTGGVHKEGSAKVTVKDGGSSSRTDGRTSTSDTMIGQIKIDINKLDLNRKQDGVNLQEVAGMDYTDQLTKKIEVTGQQFDGITGAWVDPTDPTKNEVFTIFDYDLMVDTVQDQTVKGVKKFEHRALVKNVAESGSTSVVEGWKDYIDTPPSTDPNAEASINVTEAYGASILSRDHNIFDSEDSYNQTQADENSPTGFVVLAKIQSAEVYGTKVWGAVYN